jgi:hypothetical protein
VDEDFLSRLNVAALYQRLPCGQCHEGERAGLGHGCRRGLEGSVFGRDRDVLRERADVVLPGPGKHLVPRLECGHLPTDAENGSRDVVSQDQRHLVGQDLPELTQPNLLIELVEPCGLYPDQNVPLTHGGLRNVGQLKWALVFGKYKGSHDAPKIDYNQL